ncbi:YigZ family protein [Corynebacterium sp.]|uniref:IMPACT family protein n=1 Tax=Corynebacterium sp. TaxID=1720 RepID=UPI0025BE9DE9|nr:YigZ family protein [Corynebacterium sp.]
MNVAYRRPGPGRPVAETEVRRSRFIACAARVTDEDSARAFLAEVRAGYPDARHHCSAYVLHVDGANPVERSSDDGEPAGTAGQPILEVLRGSGLQDIAVVVVRYFGGVKLGTGGLVRAYQDATREVLDGVPVTRREPRDVWALEVGHADAGKVESELRARGLSVEASYGASVTLTLTLPAGDDPGGLVREISAGTLDVVRAGARWEDVAAG